MRGGSLKVEADQPSTETECHKEPRAEYSSHVDAILTQGKTSCF